MRCERRDVCVLRYSNAQNNYNYNNNCNNNFNQNSGFPSDYMYGHAYVPNQIFRNSFCPQEGMQKGTMFPELVSPYTALDSMRVIDTLRNGGRDCR